MKQLVLTVALLALVGFGAAATVSAQEMPSGPPEEMKKLAFLVGEWDVDMDMNMGDTVENWVKSKGTCTYRYRLDGAALEMLFKSEYMGMPFTGLGTECYDRETGQWQTTWIDGMAGHITLYTGSRGEGKSTFTGSEHWQGQKYLSRISTFDETESSFNWTMEMSMDDGKTWVLSGKATYTKKK